MAQAGKHRTNRSKQTRRKSVRHVAGLLWAEHVAEGPFGPQKRRKGAKAAGLGYERKVCGALPAAIFNPWFAYMDANGKGFAQPDFLLPLKGGILAILEVKLTATPTAEEQLRELYMPIAEFLWPDREVIGVMVAKNLTSGARNVHTTLSGALRNAYTGQGQCLPLLHWLGHSPLALGDFAIDPDFRMP